MAHERLHQLSHPKFSSAFGPKFNEGVTESFTRQIYTDMSLINAPKVYVTERRVADMLMARVGEEPVARAYFRGEIGALRKRLDADLGAGTYQRFAHALSAGDLSTAEAFLR